jgi:protein-arginine kinase activator protein McsA
MKCQNCKKPASVFGTRLNKGGKLIKVQFCEDCGDAEGFKRQTPEEFKKMLSEFSGMPKNLVL